ncbi:hypothetical protein P9D55_00365 [Bacillus sonorensis]|uniref:hypothetical protein n=1 Tax=Bacillus sonorensis TaxID=119858 RepID=UPI002DBBABFB|nr:hypothetical protein [Bacillus sonorensis]MEC1534465.1 hypothetical protein [Bacillus sonorensis]
MKKMAGFTITILFSSLTLGLIQYLITGAFSQIYLLIVFPFYFFFPKIEVIIVSAVPITANNIPQMIKENDFTFGVKILLRHYFEIRSLTLNNLRIQGNGGRIIRSPSCRMYQYKIV